MSALIPVNSETCIRQAIQTFNSEHCTYYLGIHYPDLTSRQFE